MTWLKLDDGFMRHPKVVHAGKDARDLYLAGALYCAANLTDGHIPAAALSILASEAIVDDAGAATSRLLEAGLWELDHGGYRVHDFLVYNPSGASVRQQREESARRQAEWRDRRRGARNGVSNAVSNAVTNGPVTPAPYPVPGPVPGTPNPDPAGEPRAAARENGSASPARGLESIERPEEAGRVWDAAADALRQTMSRTNFDAHFGRARAVGFEPDGALLVALKTATARDQAEQKFGGLVRKILADVAGGPLSLHLVAASAVGAVEGRAPP